MIESLEVGTVAGWVTAISSMGMFAGIVSLVIGFWRHRRGIKALTNAAAEDIRDHYAEEVKRYATEVSELRDELRQCEEECRVKLKTAGDQLRKLDQELWGEKRQRVAEQISLINVIVASVDAPELKAILKTLESVQMAMRRGEQVENG